MPYSDPGAVTTGTTITSTWGNAVRNAEQYLANPPACRAFHNTTQTVASGTETTIAFNSESYDTDTMHDNVTNNSRITIKTAGLYQVNWAIILSNRTDYTNLGTYLRLNGTTVTVIGNSGPIPGNAACSPQLIGSGTYKFAVNDYVEVRANQTNTGAASSTVSGSGFNYFTATWIGLG